MANPFKTTETVITDTGVFTLHWRERYSVVSGLFGSAPKVQKAEPTIRPTDTMDKESEKARTRTFEQLAKLRRQTLVSRQSNSQGGPANVSSPKLGAGV